jgi:methylphosphotriester-DNA--protein-cysteine methyltransferase
VDLVRAWSYNRVRERIAPTGSTVAAVVLGDPIRQTPVGEGTALVTETGFLIGPHDRPIVNEPLGETFCVGIVTTPVGCRPAFGLAPATLRGRVVDLLQAWPRADALRRELTTCRTSAEALDVVEATLRTPEPFDRHALARCEAAVRQLSAEPTRPVADIATGLGVSHGHLDRQFTEQVGLSPRTLARILRMRRLLEEIDVYGSVGWAGKAAELGWSDQAHLIRDFKRHTGVTPSQYLAAQRSTYARAEAASSAGFVPETT